MFIHFASTIRGRLGAFFLAFTLLVMVSVTLTFWGIESQKQDARVINLAGRQRMLVQQMATLALELEQGRSATTIELSRAQTVFEQTLNALQNGGPAPYQDQVTVELPAANESGIQQQLATVEQTWGEFHSALQSTLQAVPGSSQHLQAQARMEQLTPLLVSQADQAVRLYEALSLQKISRLRWLQMGFLLTALLLLTLGWLTTQTTVIQPLNELGKIARRIGSGDLHTPVSLDGLAEIQVLRETLETMRNGLDSSRHELLALTTELEKRVDQRTRALEALYTVSQEISSHLDIQNVLGTVTDKARLLLGGEAAFLCLPDAEGKMLGLHAISGPEQAATLSHSPLRSIPARDVLANDQALLAAGPGCFGFCEIISPAYRRSHIAAPLRAGEQVLGALCVGSSQPGAFDREALRLLTQLANVTAVALLNARLYEQAEHAATLEERQRLAAEMHDGLLQTLSFLRLAADQLQEQIENDMLDQANITLQRMQRARQQAEAEIRQAITSLQREFPLRDSLQQELEDLARQFSQPGSEVTWNTAIDRPLVLPLEESEQVLRMVHEALSNARHHSQASHITLGLERQEGEYRVYIADDGLGFDPQSQPEDGQPHFGLSILRARASRIHGRVEIHSSPGHGTRVCLAWPASQLRKESAA